MLNHNHILIDTDSYKVSHWKMFPDGTEYVNYYLEARGVSEEFLKGSKNVFFGLRPILKELQTRITVEDVELANSYWTAHGLPFNYDGWMYIAKELDGKLPLKITAYKEGEEIDQHNVLIQVINTDPKCFWLPGWVETKLMRVWYPITVASLSRAVKKKMLAYADMTQDEPFVDFSLHDFGSRGASSNETAAIGGAAHLLSFKGSDTMAGVFYLMENYGGTDILGRNEMPGFSIPATEHSTVISYGKEHEEDAYRKFLKSFPSGAFACVSDSYDIWNAVDKIWGENLKEDILERDGFLVIRPDSGDPVDVICGSIEIHVFEGDEENIIKEASYVVRNKCLDELEDDDKNPVNSEQVVYVRQPGSEDIYKYTFEVYCDRFDKTYYYLDEVIFVKKELVEPTPEEKGLMNLLWEKFGGTINEKGYKVLNEKVRLIQGDGVCPEVIEDILNNISQQGFSTENIAFGMGGKLLQDVNRDTYKFAYKASAISIQDAWHNINKTPVGDAAKASKRGIQKLIWDGNEYVTINDESEYWYKEDQLQTVFIDGEMV